MLTKDNPFRVFIEDFEVEAENFLRKYNCEDAISNPQPIPIEEIATKMMSLDIIQTECLSIDGNVQGAIAFTQGIIEVYDAKTGDSIGFPISSPSIFVDSGIENEGRIRNTIAHECFHWWRHRNYFTYRRSHENSVEFGIRCTPQTAQDVSSAAKWNDIERMEWQARTIAPKILMPKKATYKKIEELLIELVPSGRYTNQQELTSLIVESLAIFFKVSKQSAAIRMVELGYKDAIEYCSTESQQETSAHERKHSNASSRQQSISQQEAFQLYIENEFLRTTIDTGAFYYVDGYFILKSKKYIKRLENSQFILTKYARTHLHECALDFSKRLIFEPYLIHDSTAHLMFRSDTEFIEQSIYDDNPQNTELYNKAAEFDRKFERSKAMHKTASQILNEHMKASHWNSSIFKNKTTLDSINYTRVQQNYQKFTLRPLITMGYCLGLDIDEMEEVLHAAGLSFNPTNAESQAYKFIFSAFPSRDIEECNEFLKAKGFHLLGSQSRK